MNTKTKPESPIKWIISEQVKFLIKTGIAVDQLSEFRETAIY